MVHLGINPIGALATVPGARPPANFWAVLEGYISRVSTDWFRFGSQNYVLWTEVDLAELGSAVKALPGFQNVYILATEFDPAAHKCNGMMTADFWNWLQRQRL
jgi:hypothetical protein